MPRHKFLRENEAEEEIPLNEVVSNVQYIGMYEVVETKLLCEKYPDDKLDSMERADLYALGSKIEANLNWGGDDADSESEMKEKVKNRISEICNHD